MVNFTTEEEAALEASALEAAAKLHEASAGMRDEPDLGEWEQALWADGVDILVHRRVHVAAILTREWDEYSGIYYYPVTLIGDPMLGFLAEQIHRCEAGCLNGYRPAVEVTL